MKKIVITSPLPKAGFERLNSSYRLVFPGESAFSGEALKAELSDAAVLISSFDYKIDQDMLSAAGQLTLIANYGVGFNNIDIEYATSRGIVVTNTPDPVTEPTAELTFALMLACVRRISELDQALKSGTPLPFGVMNNLGHTLYGKTLGIVGMGRIGRAVARRAVAFGMHVVYHNRHMLANEVASEYNATYLSLDDLLSLSDVVVLTTPYHASTHHLISSPQLTKMRSSAILINTARGAVVNERDLVSALNTKVIAGAGLDVYEHEPTISPELLGMKQVVLTPHIGSGTIECRLEMASAVCQNIEHFDEHDYGSMTIVNKAVIELHS